MRAGSGTADSFVQSVTYDDDTSFIFVYGKRHVRCCYPTTTRCWYLFLCGIHVFATIDCPLYIGRWI